MTRLNSWKQIVLFFIMCAAMSVMVHAQTFTSVHSFDLSDGAYPGPLVQGTDGRLYGTTQFGGTNSSNCKDSGLACGTVRNDSGGRLNYALQFLRPSEM